MRTSNKIIVGIFLAPLIILTAIHVTLYAKYKSGNYVSMKKVTEDRFTRLALTHIISVSVYGLNNFNIIPSDTATLEMEKLQNDRLHYVVNGDSLVIRADSTSETNGNFPRNYQAINLYLPGNATIYANNSSIDLFGTADSLKAASYRFTLNNSSDLETRQRDDRPTFHFKELLIGATPSCKIALSPGCRVNSMDLNLQDTEFTDNSASIDNLKIIADKKSLITLRGDNLLKLNLAKQP